MPRKYCVMIDSSANSLKAAEMCAHMCKEGDEVNMYTNIPRHAYHSPYNTNTEYTESHQTAIRKASDLFKDIKLGAITMKMDVTPDVRANVEEFCKSINPDMIFMGSRGFGEIRGVLGSVSQYVLHHYEKGALCIVKADKENAAPASEEGVNGGKHYFLCVDGSDHAKRAAQQIAPCLQPQDKITAFAALDAPPQYYPIIPAMGIEPATVCWKDNNTYEEELTTAKKKALELAEEAKGCLLAASPDLKEEQITTRGGVDCIGVAKMIAKRVEDPANHVDVVVLGTRGRGLVKRMLMGSVSNEVLHAVDNKAFIIVH